MAEFNYYFIYILREEGIYYFNVKRDGLTSGMRYGSYRPKARLYATLDEANKDLDLMVDVYPQAKIGICRFSTEEVL